MMKLPTLFFIIALMLLMSVHVIALRLFLYWQIWWLDIPMHILGGVVISVGIFALHDMRLWIKKRHLSYIPVLLLVCVAALSWEVYELCVGTAIEENYLMDTITDLAMGLVGGTIGYTIGTRISK